MKSVSKSAVQTCCCDMYTVRSNSMDKIPRPCRHGGCMVLTTEGYCDKHKAEHSQRSNPKRESSSARLYGYRWRKESKLLLAVHPYCAECERQGRRTLATEVDHIKPHKKDMRLFWDKSNWQSLCHRCHSTKTVREDGGFGNRVKS